MAKAYVAGTCDTKGAELRYIQELIEAAGVKTCLVDLGSHFRHPSPFLPIYPSSMAVTKSWA